MEASLNAVFLRGTLAGKPEFSHIGGGDNYYVFPLEVSRLSGRSDRLNIIARDTLLERTGIADGDKVAVTGELRSYNNRSGVGAKLVITVLARELLITTGEDENTVTLSGVLCRAPTLRRTPMGRRICDVLLAVNRRCGRSDYLPVIAWGGAAERAARLTVGDGLSLSGRLQSRSYIKSIDGAVEERTAFEVSVTELISADQVSENLNFL